MFAQRSALGAGLLFGLLSAVRAVPSINVGLRSSFEAPPFLVELLETAAEENATAYFPLLDRIAHGYFDGAATEKELYTKFRNVLQEDGHLSQAEDLSSFDFALSIHSAAPRIEAFHQYYATTVEPLLQQDGTERNDCESWLHVPFSGQRYCSPDLSADTALLISHAGDSAHTLPFDRILGDSGSPRPSILYADISSESFRSFHKTLLSTAKDGKTSYRVRYKPGRSSETTPLAVSGYGVELALKRTDYIVIDDRQAKEGQAETGGASSGEPTLSAEDVSDLRPLSASELQRLGLKSASFVLNSEDPLDTLAKLSQDFPKHSGAMAGMNVSHEFLFEHSQNRKALLASGFNVIWINGVQIMARDFNAYSLLEHLRRERKMINGVRELGLSGRQAIDLLSHEAITASQVSLDIQRYDWRDDIEGGNVIMWLNDIEKDKRYAEWPAGVTSLLQRTYAGQLPQVRKEVHNLVIPIDFANYADVYLVVESLQGFVKRKIPIRFGLVPRYTSPSSAEQAKIMYHLLDAYGLATALDYLKTAIGGAGRKFGPVQQQYFQKSIDGQKLRKDQTALSAIDVLEDGELTARLKAARAYYKRLGESEAIPPIFINGVALPKTEEWLQTMSQRVGLDSQIIQRAVYEGTLTQESYLPELFLVTASATRMPLLIPEDDQDVRHVDLGDLPELGKLPSFPSDQDTVERELVHMVLVADLDTPNGFEQLMEALLFRRDHDNVEIALMHVPGSTTSTSQLSKTLESSPEGVLRNLLKDFDARLDSQKQEAKEIYKEIFQSFSSETPSETSAGSEAAQTAFKSLLNTIDIAPGQRAILVNGRVVGPIDEDTTLDVSALETLLSYERKLRLLPASLAIDGMGLENMAGTPFAFAKISNLIALSQVSDVPEGIFEAAPTIRTSIFNRWASTHTAVKIGDIDTANVQIVASIDPASELAQRWIPIIKALSELDGVYTCLYLNPKDRLDELPVKRFYRYVLESKPTFAPDGSLQDLGAHFSGLPAEALLNIGMDLPPSWLVAPKDSVHDLDNIKLSAVKTGTDIEAIYELEHILIEGHSRDVTTGPPPRGAQLILGTELEPHFADTLVMANFGYFQFKANPGVYSLSLQSGRSDDIFHIDSAGSLGYSPQPGDNGTEIALTSFRGATLFPRLSRKPGMEDEDVLESSKSTLENLADGADKLLAQAGLSGSQAGKYLSKAAKLGSSFLSGTVKSTDVTAEPHADINIFSVASGHLYERMLNIMMLSVMKHTQHTVKFWFIEQFLSPSFKDFLPVLAQEYGFKYEMVTYKWPHWLRGQKEKQREIWGYKILFLDVLFPLDLDKVIFVDADQIVRTDMYELVQHNLHGAPYGFTPMCDSRTEMEGFRFWKQGYWEKFLQGLPYHISALYVVDLKKFRQIAAGDRLRQQYHSLSADPASLSNLDQDLPNHMQMVLPIHSLPQDWLWCETWCSDEALKTAKTIDLCNNPQTKEPKLDRARRQVPEWTVYDEEIAAVARTHKQRSAEGSPVAGDAADAGVQGEEESIQEQLQREDAEKEERKQQERVRDEL